MTDPDLGWLSDSLDAEAVTRAAQRTSELIISSALDVVASQDLLSEFYVEAVDDELQMATSVADFLAWEALNSDPRAARTRSLCRQAFSLLRGQLLDSNGASSEPRDEASSKEAILKVACLGWLGDETALAGRLLADVQVGASGNDSGWDARLHLAVMDVWLLLLRKKSWDDIDEVFGILNNVEAAQHAEELAFLSRVDTGSTEAEDLVPSLWEIVWAYQMLRASRVVVLFSLQGVLEDRVSTYDPKETAQAFMDRALAAAEAAASPRLVELTTLLARTAEQLIDNSIWSIARSSNPLTRRFVESLTARRGGRPLLELLPPQRAALAESGLVRGGARSVVVSLPTSSGKTLIAQFRMLEALNAFASQDGWVAYVAPTRALVNQVTRRLRRDFAPLNINVEQVSPALEVDSPEAALLAAGSEEEKFHILVATPEKLDLLVRSGWTRRTERPLTLIVLDEAHNLAQSDRGVRMELLLATLNREVRDAQFLLLTPFIPNASEIAAWLDPTSNNSVELSLEWSPNDRIIALATRNKGSRSGDFTVDLETVATTRETLASEMPVTLGENRPLGISWSTAKAQGALAASAAACLTGRGTTITMVQQPAHAWSVAERISSGSDLGELDSDLLAVSDFVADEYGENFPLVRYLERKVGVHHAGLSHEVRTLTEWLTETERLEHLVATTTIAQGVNFPVANVVVASHQHPYGVDISPSDFWNIAGRAGRVDQGQVGVVALAAPTAERVQILQTFIDRQVGALASQLVRMVEEVLRTSTELNLVSLSYREEWSSFVQFLSHTYRQVNDPQVFAREAESILRGTFGFQRLREQRPDVANEVIRAVREYGGLLRGEPLALVDATAFSMESVKNALRRLSEARIGPDVWGPDLYTTERSTLARIVGVMLEVPELRQNLTEAAHGQGQAGDFLARVMADWVAGRPIPEIAREHFPAKRPNDTLTSMTNCCQRLFGKIAPTVAWGLSAMQSLSIGSAIDELEETEQRRIRSLPSYAFYGVNTESAVGMRLIGVPRRAAIALSVEGELTGSLSPAILRRELRSTSTDIWRRAMGEVGSSYQRCWQIIDGA